MVTKPDLCLCVCLVYCVYVLCVFCVSVRLCVFVCVCAWPGTAKKRSRTEFTIVNQTELGDDTPIEYRIWSPNISCIQRF